MKKLLKAFVLTLAFTGIAYAYIDPFLNPLYVREIVEWQKKERKLEAKKKVITVVKKPRVFKLTMPPLEKLVLEGVIGSGNTLKAVAADPETGKVYLLAPGDIVDVNAKVLKVLPNKLVLKVYEKKGNRLISSVVTINFNSEEGK